MITVNNIDAFIDGIYDFQLHIEYEGGTSPAAVIAQAVAKDPGIGVYIAEQKTKVVEGKVVFDFKYTNTEVKRQDIVHVSDGYQAEDAMINAVEQFQKRLVVFPKPGVDLDYKALYSDFVANKAFYSNLQIVSYQSYTWKTYKIKFAVFKFEYRIGKVLSDMLKRELNDKLKEVASAIFSKSMTPEIKAYVAHNYLAKTVEYWYTGGKKLNPVDKGYKQSAYGALVNKKCVCQGFAEAYKRLLDTQGITCYVVHGQVKGQLCTHAWNVVSFDNKEYFHVDVTWDATSADKTIDKYFGCTDKEMAYNRTWTKRATWVCSGRTPLRLLVQAQIRQRKALLLSEGIDNKYLEV